MEDTSERPAVAIGAAPAGADGDGDKLTYLYEGVVNDERWKTVAHIIGAENLAMETAGLELEGEAWAEERFGAEARRSIESGGARLRGRVHRVRQRAVGGNTRSRRPHPFAR
ncbi:hypothetical protein [Microbacterium testaceum]|uniref:hypothetical protein n=1 Tax=Microbacterium testaceum TaxID=2033 RepID=UPI002AC76217|nr:hypothetical protein [Microbacterium testaceum]MDZ5146321.1 hypothetical protein [Microbacterium testaceum]